MKNRGGSINKRDYKEIVNMVALNSAKKILEFGPGDSTWSFLENGCKVWGLEDSKIWAEQHIERFAERDDVTIIKYDSYRRPFYIDKINDIEFDMAFIDGPPGGRFEACNYAASRVNTFLMHDARRSGEQKILKYFQDLGWLCKHIRGSCIAIFQYLPNMKKRKKKILFSLNPPIFH